MPLLSHEENIRKVKYKLCKNIVSTFSLVGISQAEDKLIRAVQDPSKLYISRRGKRFRTSIKTLIILRF